MTDALDVGQQTDMRDRTPYHCKPCGVSWAGEARCWVCGQDTAPRFQLFVPLPRAVRAR